MTVLELRDIEAGYGPFRALFGVSLRIEPGGAVALVGANGAGKTTLARVASGLIEPTGGAVLVNGVDMRGARTHRFARAGVFHAPEGRSVFGTLTVAENLELGTRGRRAQPGALERAFDLFPRLGERRTQLAGTLSGGEQRMLALAAATMETPALLVADELSLGLAPVVIEAVYRYLAEIRQTGTALLIVEQQVAQAFALCDEVVLLRRGEVSWTGPAADAAAVITAILDPAPERQEC